MTRRKTYRSCSGKLLQTSYLNVKEPILLVMMTKPFLNGLGLMLIHFSLILALLSYSINPTEYLSPITSWHPRSFEKSEIESRKNGKLKTKRAKSLQSIHMRQSRTKINSGLYSQGLNTYLIKLRSSSWNRVTTTHGLDKVA